MRVTIEARGPVFDGRASRAADALVQDVVREVADEGLSIWRGNLNGSLRHQTGRYLSRTTVSRHGDQAVVHDQMMVYGPWLEGVGSRNRTTRFKGYFAMRRAFQRLVSRVPAIAERVLRRYLAVMR